MLRRRASVSEVRESRARRRECVRAVVSELRVRIRVVRESRVGRGDPWDCVGVRVEVRVLICVERWASVGRMEVCDDDAVGRVVDRPRADSREVSRSEKREIAAMVDGLVSGGSACVSGCCLLGVCFSGTG